MPEKNHANEEKDKMIENNDLINKERECCLFFS